MQVQYIGANCRTGVSEKTGRPYTIAELLYMVPDGPSEKIAEDGTVIWRYAAHGNKVRSVNLDSSKISQFAKCEPGSKIDLILEPVPDNPTRNQVVGIR